MKKNCKTCGVEFAITKWQTTKQYCNDSCKPTFRPNRGKPRGRPKIDLPTYTVVVVNGKPIEELKEKFVGGFSLVKKRWSLK